MTREDGRVITLAGEARLGTGGAPAYRLRVGYSAPLEVALAPRRDIARVRGRVTDDAGRPVAGLVLRLGSLTARTDAAGGYDFPAVPPGVFYLTADGAQTGAERVGVPALPLRLELGARETREQNVALLRAARLEGRLTVVRDSGTLGGGVGERVDDERALVAGVLLELRRADGTVLRTQSDEAGAFRFEGVAPGGWTLSVLSADAPRYAGFRFGGPDGPLTLRGGEPTRVEITLAPRRRDLRLQEGGTLGAPTLTPTPPKP